MSITTAVFLKINDLCFLYSIATVYEFESVTQHSNNQILNLQLQSNKIETEDNRICIRIVNQRLKHYSVTSDNKLKTIDSP